MNEYRKLGDLLVRQGLLTNLQLSVALSAQQTSNRRLGEILVERGYAGEEQIAGCLAEQYGYPLADLDALHPTAEALELVTSNIALAYCVLPISVDDERFQCALADPIDVITTDLLSQIVRRRLDLQIAPQKALTQAIRQAYRLEQGPATDTSEHVAYVPERYIQPKPRRKLGIATMIDAFDRELDRGVTLLTVPSGSVEEWEQFQLVRSAARAQHKNVCTVYDWIEANGHRWTVVEALEGETLDTMLRTRGPRSVAQAAELVAQIADGLESIGQRGGPSNLVCPGNILVRWTGPLLTPLTKPPAAYGCPEMFAERGGSGSADVFALGTLLWECVTGDNPHASGDGEEVWWSEASKAPTRLPAAFRTVLAGCLDADPAKRFTSPFHLANTLRSYNWSALSVTDESTRFDDSGDRDHLLDLLDVESNAKPSFWDRLFGKRRAA